MISSRLPRTAGFRTALLYSAVCSSIGIAVFATVTASRGDTTGPISNLSQANRLSLFHDYSIDAVGLVSGDVPGTQGGGVASYLMGNWKDSDITGTGRSYEINVTPLAGYDSNPEARRSQQAGEFVGADLNAAYRFDFGTDDATIGHPGEIKVYYDAVGAIYSGQVFKADTLQQTVGSTFHRRLWDNTVVLGMLIDDQFTMEHGDGILNTFDVAPSAEIFLLPQSSVEIGYAYARLDYELRTELIKDPDANRHTISAQYHFYPTPQKAGPVPESPDVLGDILRQSLHRATVGYDYVFNRAAGDDYVYEGNRVYIGLDGLQIPGAPDINFDIRYAHEWDQYSNPNVEGPTVLAGRPITQKRQDHIDVFTLRGNARLLDLPKNRGTLSTYAQFDIIADRSNIDARHFNEYSFSTGISYRY